MRFPRITRTRLFAGLLTMAGLGLLATLYSVLTLDYRYSQLLRNGDALVEQQQPFQATQLYDAALVLDPGKATAYAKRASAHEIQGNLTASLADLEAAFERAPDSLSLASRLAELNHRLERFEEAAQQYRRCVELDPTSAENFYQLGLVSFRAGREAEAIEALNRAAGLRRGFWQAIYVRGAVFQALGAKEEAEADFRRAMELNTEASEPREALIDFYLERRSPRDALPLIQDQIDQVPHRVQPYLQLAEARRLQGLPQQAIEAVGTALEQSPNSPEAYSQLGELWLAEAGRAGDPIALDKAISALESVAKMAPEDGSAALILGRAYLANGEEEKGFAELRRASEATPVEPEAHRLMGDIYHARGQFDEAMSAYLVYVKLKGDTPVILERLGDTYLSMSKPDAAADIYLQSAALEPGRVDALAKAAQAYLLAGDPAAAARACRRGLAISPRNETLLGLLRRTQDPPAESAAPTSLARRRHRKTP